MQPLPYLANSGGLGHTDCSVPKGFGFVEFEDPAEAANARAAMDGKELDGRKLSVDFAREKRKSAGAGWRALRMAARALCVVLFAC